MDLPVDSMGQLNNKEAKILEKAEKMTKKVYVTLSSALTLYHFSEYLYWDWCRMQLQIICQGCEPQALACSTRLSAIHSRVEASI